jgi:hypothetical protein
MAYLPSEFRNPKTSIETPVSKRFGMPKMFFSVTRVLLVSYRILVICSASVMNSKHKGKESVDEFVTSLTTEIFSGRIKPHCVLLTLQRFLLNHTLSMSTRMEAMHSEVLVNGSVDHVSVINFLQFLRHADFVSREGFE